MEKKRKWYVYLIKSSLHPISNGYIGKTWDLIRRWKSHKNAVKRGVKGYFYNSMRKYGIENFTFVILSIHRTESASLKNEIKMIKKFNTLRPHGYNLTLGGDGTSGYVPSKKTLEKISASLKGRRLTLEHRENVRISGIGRKHSNKTKIKMSKSMIGKNLGKIRTPEQIIEMRNCQLGKKHKPFTKKQKENMSDGHFMGFLNKFLLQELMKSSK